jgi:2-polyprenyl-3-methyl-5-hydroxy-6-metoxy-1,4-benzoquinol methylase
MSGIRLARASGELSGARVPTGNTFDKYGSANQLVRRLMSGFDSALSELFAAAAPRSVLDVGCGEGVITNRWAEQLGEGQVVGVDLPDPKLESEWAVRRRANLQFRALDGDRLPFADDEFDLAAAIEVLEHVSEPERTIKEMARIAACHLLVSVPREPMWRALNLARGAYPRQFGNTPGHLNHWSSTKFVQLLERYGQVLAVRRPLPWTMLLVRVR